MLVALLDLLQSSGPGHPTPGTVLDAGYGNSLTEPDALAFRQLSRTSDDCFVKLSYLLRM